MQLLIAALLLVPSLASADPVQLTSGTIVATGPGTLGTLTVTIAGDDFSAVLVGSGLAPTFLPAESCPCLPGEEVPNFGFLVSGPGVSGTAIVDGVSYTAGPGPFSHFLSAFFGGPPFLLPTVVPDTAITLFSTFTLTGEFQSSPLVLPPGVVPFSVDFTGSGIAAATFSPFEHPGLGPAFRFESALYTLVNPVAVPEPTSLLLLGTGLLALRRRSH